MLHIWSISHRFCHRLNHISLECPNNNSLMLKPTWNQKSCPFTRFPTIVISWNLWETCSHVTQSCSGCCLWFHPVTCEPFLQFFCKLLTGILKMVLPMPLFSPQLLCSAQVFEGLGMRKEWTIVVDCIFLRRHTIPRDGQIIPHALLTKWLYWFSVSV